MIGATLLHYRLLEKLGEGASGVVYKADDLTLGRAVALKVLPSTLASNPSAIVRFQHEARIASSLSHPNICTIHEIADHDGQPFIVMELLQGSLLADIIAGQALPLDRILDLTIQLSDALDAAHAEGVVHRDLKPSNIFVTDRGHVKILDFGLALLLAPATKSHDSSSGYRSSAVGTAPYMSPEQARGEELDARSDLFAVGIVLYEMATGCRPFNGKTRAETMDAIMKSAPIAACELNGAVPAELQRILDKALEKNRALRFQTAADLRADLQRLKRDIERGPAAPARQWIESRRSRQWTHVTVLAAIIAGVAILRFGGKLLPPTSPLTVTVPEVPAARKEPATPPTVPADAGTRGSAVGPGQPRRAGPAPPPAKAATVVPVPVDLAQQELRVARTKAEAGLHSQALATLRDLVSRYAGTDAAIDGSFLIATINEDQKQFDDALATYLEIAERYAHHGRAPEALVRFAQTTLRSSRRQRFAEARDALANVADRYPVSTWAPQALLEKGELEERQKLRDHDGRGGGDVPSALITYRRLATDYPDNPATGSALPRLARLYEQTKRYEMAAMVWTHLASSYPHSSEDPWFRAAEIYRRRLGDSAKARVAYERVPQTSKHYEDAQKRLR